jgi:uncharacterized membrane protein HdeD (DUF308 family)
MNNDKLGIPINPLSAQQLKDNWGWYFGLGIGLIVLGFLAIIFSWASTIFSVIYLGFFLITIGMFEGVQSFKMSLWSSFFLHLFLSILFIVGGFFTVVHPAANAITLTLLLAIFFVVSGILKIVFALSMYILHRGWLILNGALTLFLGILIWQQWPASGFWVIGLFVGIDAIFTGWTWVMLSLTAKNLPSDIYT